MHGWRKWLNGDRRDNESEPNLRPYAYCLFLFTSISSQGCTQPGREVVRVTGFCVVTLKTFWSSLWNLPHVTLLATRIFKASPWFWKTCALLFISVIFRFILFPRKIYYGRVCLLLLYVQFDSPCQRICNCWLNKQHFVEDFWMVFRYAVFNMTS
jgi:hypothetical protein